VAVKRVAAPPERNASKAGRQILLLHAYIKRGGKSRFFEANYDPYLAELGQFLNVISLY
jgi:hypothetical protein